MFEAEPITGTNFDSNLLIDFLRPPFRKFEIRTPMNPEDAVRVLQEIVEAARFFRWPSFGDHRFFEGRVAGDRFKIQRFINYQNAWLPVIEGTFRPDNIGTIVTVKIRLIWPLVVGLSGTMALLLWAFVAMDWHSPGFLSARMLILGAMLFFYLVTTISFASEVRSAMKRLLKLPWSSAPNSDSSP
jgi:hypothetical protein